MSEKLNIKKLIEEDNYIIVLDTNVILRLYDYSPEFSTFALNCLHKITQHLIIPYTVKIEYETHFRSKFSNMKYRIENYDKKAIEQIESFEKNIVNICNDISKYNFPDIDALLKNVKSCINDMKIEFSDYLQEHDFLENLNQEWLKKDVIAEFFEKLVKNNQIMNCLLLEEIYRICNDGAKRYKDKIPPGYKDAKDKDGLRKYSDLILWKETIKYAENNKVNIIFVTNDIKADWWEQSDSNLFFHSKLIDEFNKDSSKNIIGIQSNELFANVANDYRVYKSDAVELVLTKTACDYGQEVCDEIFDTIFPSLYYSGEDFIDSDSSEYSGSVGIDLSDDCDEYSLISAELNEIDNDSIFYTFMYEVTIGATSYEYWGKDEKTKEAVLSPANHHKFKGVIEVEVERKIDSFVDFMGDNTFFSAQIVNGHLKEIEFISHYDLEDEDKSDIDSQYTCPHCSRAISFENDAGTGFCIDCEREKL